MRALEKFKEVCENRHHYTQDWKSRHSGGKVLGYFYDGFPEEIPYAAGILPIRLLGSHEVEHVTAPYISSRFCPHCRDVLAQGLEGKYDYLNAIASSNCCMHMLQSFEVWAVRVKPPIYLRVDTPGSTQNPHCKHYLREELQCFKQDVEEWIGNEITAEGLGQAIEVYNENRRLMRQVYELRKADNPPITGLECLYMVVSSQLMDKEEHNLLLKEALEELNSQKPHRETGTRLMLVGSVNDDVEFHKLIEQGLVLPATVVIDEHCTGSTYFWNEVVPNSDHLYALASRYIDQPPCPNKDWPAHRRFPHVLNLAKEWRADGAIIVHQKFCDPHEMDIPLLTEYLEKNGVQTYFLELDVPVPIGQFRIRLEAFVETLVPGVV